MLQEIIQQYTAKAEAKGICLIVQDTDEQAVFDLKWTTEALGNVVDNAVKYTHPGGTVRITVTMYELFCRIDVADTGIGIARGGTGAYFFPFLSFTAGGAAGWRGHWSASGAADFV